MRVLKSVLLNRTVLSVTACLALAVSIPVICAAHDEGGDEHEQRDQQARILLQPTPNAPTNALGLAEIESDDNDGAVVGHIEVKTKGLLPGTYTVTIYNRAQDASAILGTFTVGGSHHDDDGEGDGEGEHSGGSDDNENEGDAGNGEGGAEFPLPDNIGVLDVGVISIVDAGGAEVLRGDFASADSMLVGNISATVPASGGEAAPGASGIAAIKGHVRRGHANGVFALTARQLPPRTTMILNVNGTDVSSMRTNRRGELRVRKSNRVVNVFRVSSVRLLTESGETALRADF